jgi:hypothetical protein
MEAAVLFHIKQVHTPENCPYGKGGLRSLHDDSVPGVKLLGIYAAQMAHTIYLIVDADNIDDLNRFLLPGMKSCIAEITPVNDHPIPL